MTTPILVAIISGITLLVFGGYAVFDTLSREAKRKNNQTRRLSIETSPLKNGVEEIEEVNDISQGKIAKRALSFATGGDKEKVARLRKMLIRSGDFDPASTAKFVLNRFLLMGVGLVLALAFTFIKEISLLTPRGVSIVGGFAFVGYFVPNLLLMQKTKQRVLEYRNGFPDFMDLMIVCSDAGLSLEASIERVSRELVTTYPYLAHNLMTFSLELRAGRNIHDAMKSFGDRVGLEEIDAFAVLLKQSKELGTSLSSTLRVYSEEMRDKRMSKAEEKAHALPAKMTIPVTVCILPTVVMIAIIPVIVSLSTTQ